MTPPREHHNVPVTNPKLMEICDLSDKKYKTVVLKMLNELSEKKSTKLRKQYINKIRNLTEIKVILKNTKKYWS